ncbi:MAG: APC family permease [Neisseriaceae bacterium]|nr:APC family permease [Neisseriaceae bacterium]
MTQQVQLAKKLSPMNVWALAFGCIIGWGAFVMPGNTFLGAAGPVGTAIAMSIAIIVMIIIAFNYDYMINHHPVAGGEFTYALRAFGAKHAFICSWFLVLSYLAIVPLNATALALIGRNLLDNIFQVGFHYSVAGYDIYLGEIILAITALLMFAFLSIRGVKFTGVFQTILALSLVTGVLLVIGAAFVSPHATLSNLNPGFNPDSGKLAGILAVVAVAPWAFVGFDTIPQGAEEFNFSSRKAKAIMVISILFGGLVYIALNTVTAAVIPQGYDSWTAYIADFKNLNGLISLPTFHAAYTLLGNWGLIFLGLAVLAAILSGIIGFYMAASRLLFSMSRDHMLPAWFGKLHNEYKTPRNAIFFIMLISLIAPFFGRTALGWIVDMSSIGAAIGYGYTSASAFVYAKQKGNGFIQATGFLGVIFSLIFAILLLIPLPGLNCSLGTESYICLIIWVVLGFIFYYKSPSFFVKTSHHNQSTIKIL